MNVVEACSVLTPFMQRDLRVLPPATYCQPELVEDVDSQGSFKMFDAGWILPTGQKRGGSRARGTSTTVSTTQHIPVDGGLHWLDRK